MSQGMDEMLDFGLGDYDSDDDNFGDGARPPESNDGDAESTDEMPLKDRWADTMARLQNEEVRWDQVDSDDDVGRENEGNRASTPFLDIRTKKSLARVDIKNLGKTTPTVLHLLANKNINLDGDGFGRLAQATQIKIVEYLLQERVGNSQHTTDEDPILTIAMIWNNIDFIEFVIKHCSSHLPELLDARDNKAANCLHYLFKVHLPNKVGSLTRAMRASTEREPQARKEVGSTLKMLGDFIKHAKPTTASAGDILGNAPIHYAMDYKICRACAPILQYPGLVLNLMKKADKANDRDRQLNKEKESPYLYFNRTRDFYLADRERKRQEHAQKQAKVASNVAPESKVAASGKANWDVKPEVSSRGVSVKDFQSKMNPKDLAAPKRMPVGATSVAPPPQDGRGEPNSSIMRAKDASLMGAPPGYGLHRTRTAADISSSSANPQAQVTPFSSIGPQDSSRTGRAHTEASSIEKLSVGSQAGSRNLSMKPGPVTQFNTEKQTLSSVGEPKRISQDEAAQGIQRQLKLHYIRSRPDMEEAKELLYGRVASDKNLYFDATHLKGKSPSDVASLILMLNQPGGFEDTLSYVSLPVLSYTSESPAGAVFNTTKPNNANERRQREPNGNEYKMLGRNSAVAVFDKLATVGVRNIIRLVVEEDPKSRPHTDCAIERAVRGWDSLNPENKRSEEKSSIAVEIWDWRKFDLSTDVIGKCSPKIRQVNLYWSGNQTVLQGWASADGITSLWKDSDENCLEKITVHWLPGYEGSGQCKILLDNFKHHVESKTKNKVAVDHKQLTSSDADGSGTDGYLGAVTLDNPMPPDHLWIDAMKNFRTALMTVHSTLPQGVNPKRIKVALIDDGFDCSNMLTYGDRVEVTGMSYWRSTPGRALPTPSWYQSTHGHGTIMGNSIARVNPWVSLCVMRIEDEADRGDKTIRIHAASAARAIEDAIIREVDIISISWTIRNLARSADAGAGLQQPREVQDVQQLRAAIRRVKEQGILLFCSASDSIQNSGAESLPYSEATEYAFRIGAADAFGVRDKVTEDQHKISYYFPGNQVADDMNPRTMRASDLKHRDGSSVATALAAGLASLILYLTNVMGARHGDKNGAFANHNKKLRTREGLRKAFETIVNMHVDYKDRKFLPVWELFGEKAKMITETKDDEAKWAILADICIKLAT